MKNRVRRTIAAVAIGAVSAVVAALLLSVIPSGVAPHPIAGYVWDNVGIFWALWTIFWWVVLTPGT